jgi:cyclophilin family peptidyl-prolyl cis-trans isomerase
MRTLRWRIGSFFVLAAGVAALATRPALALTCVAPAPGVRERVGLVTDYGMLRLELFDLPGEVPAATAANFLNYVNRGDFDGSFFHRLVANFVLQGGGYTWDAVNRYQEVPQDPPVANQYRYCNVRGTVAMAKSPGDPNSATTEFFINLVDNSAVLENQNGGFTVFARVVPADLHILDALAALHTEYGPFMVDDPLGAVFTSLPVKNILQREPGGFGCIQAIQPDPHPDLGPMGTQNCATTEAFDAAIELWKDAMDPRVPPQLVTIHEVVVPEPGAALGLATGATTLAVLRLASRRRVS